MPRGRTNDVRVIVGIILLFAATIQTNLHRQSLGSLEKIESSSGTSTVLDDIVPSIVAVDSDSTTLTPSMTQTNTTTNPPIPDITVPISDDVSSSTNYTQSKTTHERRHSIWGYPLQDQQEQTNCKQQTRAVVLLSMGPQAMESTLVERCIISIRSRGRYFGPILLLTDAPSSRFAPLVDEDDQLILMHPYPADWNFELKRDLPYKRFKTYVLSYLDRDDRLRNLSFAYYLDFDLVVGKEPQDWFIHVESQYLTPGSTSTSELGFFEGNFSPLQGGQFVARKGQSEGCLERWRYYMDSDLNEHKDQVSLTKMWDEQQPGSSNSSGFVNCTLLRMPQKPYIMFLSTKEMVSLKGGDKKNVTYPTLMHIKNTDHARLIPKKIQLQFYENLLELPSELVVNITAGRRIRPNRTCTQEQVNRGYS